MRVPFSWLREYCDPGLSAEELAELLSLRAVEVERVATVGPPSPDGFVVGHVLAAEGHPDADRLFVCTVDAGDGERTIVCGAPNVAAGQTVAVALPGAVMPGGETLEKAKLRGVESAGMILAEDELALGPDHEGILVLDDVEAPPGTPLTDVYPVTEQVLELELNPNRPDCLGVYGVAREVHAVTGAPLAPAPWEAEAEPTGEKPVADLATVTVEVPELCPRFTARAFTNVTMGPSPLWLRARLAAAGQRPISNVVDVTNYVMLMIGQPIHAFDLDKVPGGELIIRRAAEGETMTTLDGVERDLTRETVLVCDREQPTGIAGIMGGQVSEVGDATTSVLLEVANWDGTNIMHTSSALGLRSEASTRFEKQLHPELTIHAQRIASRLIVELAGADLAPGMIDESAGAPAPHVISLRTARIQALLGIPVARDDAAEYLSRLGFAVEVDGGDLEVEVTPERHYDVYREVDLIEEVGRLHGLDRLPRTLPAHGQRRGGLTREQRLRRRIEDAMRDLGFDEAAGWGLSSPALADRLRLPADDPRRTRFVRIANPLSEDGSVMRTTLIGELLDAARYNLARGAEGVALFESGRAFLAEAPPATGGTEAGAFPGTMPAPDREPHRLAALLVGPVRPQSWRGETDPGDFYALKGVLEALCGRFGIGVRLEPGAEPFLHPGRAAAAFVGDEPAGWIGELHPAVAADWDLPAGTAFELDIAPLIAATRAGEEIYEDVTTHPAVVEDLAVAVAEDVPAERVVATVSEAGGELLGAVRIFDLYRGDQVGPGLKSLALRLEFRAPDRTLTDDEVAGHRQRIAAALEDIGGSLRA
jgi:phenylalanyl-tRNA synthetase beta chain